MVYAASSMSSQGELTVVVKRRIKPGKEAEFEESDAKLRPIRACFSRSSRHQHFASPGVGRDYIVVDRFSDASARGSFKASIQYHDWMNRLAELTEGDPRIEELSGLEGWFTLPEDAGLAKPPKYKMALATFLGVFPVVMGLSLTLGPAIRSWPFMVSSAVFNASVVVLLTWVVMPLITRMLHPWLFPQES